MFGCRLPGARRRTKWSAKRVESSGVPCLDAGSIPATSTLGLRLSQAFFCVVRAVRGAVRKGRQRCCLTWLRIVCPQTSFRPTIPIPVRYAHAFAPSFNAAIVSVALILFGVAAFAEIKFPQMTASIGCPSNRPTPATSTLGLRFVAGLFCVVCAVRGAVRKGGQRCCLSISPQSPHTSHTPHKKNNSSLLTTHYSLTIECFYDPCYDKACYYRQKLF